jgi:arylsulfatase A-like enzyme
MMSHLDFSIGRVIKSLKNRKVLKDTLIVIFSDNGPSKPGPKWYINPKDHQKNFWGNNGAYGSVGSLRGWKATPHEGGIRVPLAIHWEGKIQPTTYHKSAQIQDLYPTILNAIGIDLNTSRQVEGRNLYPSIINPSLAPAPVNFYWRDQNTLTYRMNHWKLIIHHPSPFSSDARSELFNLNDDINESDNCIARFPKIYKKILSHLREEYRNDPEVHVDPFMRGK